MEDNLSCNIQSLLILLALLYIAHKIFCFLARFLVIPHDIFKRYGPGWAVVTGGSDGIGLGFCQQLAKLGFNICIIGRNNEKITKVCSQLIKINGNIKTKIIIADFCNCLGKNFYGQIKKELQQIEISILVNNVGIMLNPSQLVDLDPLKIQQQMTINIFPISRLIRELLPSMISRYDMNNKKSLVINLSSLAADYPSRYAANYSSTKLFDDFLSRSVGYENQDKIDFLSLRPCLVTTAMTRNTRSFVHVSKNQCVKGALKMAGKRDYTYGHWWHEIQGFVLLLLPYEVRNIIIASTQYEIKKLYEQIDSKKK